MPTSETTQRSASGRIVTFYSFKGGVGRTMALANVAFLAAMNRKRVLVMDWDVEAPGLHYYFRGMQDTTAAKALRAAPGVLDLVWQWSTALRGAEAVTDVKELVDRYRGGAPFREMVQSLLPDFDDDGGLLHHIGAGSSTIAIPDLVPYEEALARFDWSSFFADEAGGVLLSALRDWAKSEYDYIFLDSRTGFADVAGICTMQIPDQVALCYIYNRQNIDGIAQVAGAIRSRRGRDVELRGVPMRVARENTSEEAEARARARKELTRKGGFSADAVEQDQKVLSVKQAPNVPFYETIALITSDRPRSDPLALDYLNLASQLLGTDLEMPQLYEGWVERVRRRLQPRQVAPDYLLSLRSKDTDRATEEVAQLLENLVEEGVDDETDPDYLRALVATATYLSRTAEDPFAVQQIMTPTLDLLRDLAARDPHQWNLPFGEFMESYIDQMGVMLEDDDELLLLDEVDAILAGVADDGAKLRRLANRRRAARIHLFQGHVDSAAQTAAELSRIISDLSGRSSAEARLDLLAAELDTALLRGDILIRQGKIDAARRLFESALKLGTVDELGSRQELMRLRFDLHLALANLRPPTIGKAEAAHHALEALKWIGSGNAIILHAVDLGRAILRNEDPEQLKQFVRKAFRTGDRRQSQFVSFSGRNVRGAIRLTRFVREAVELLSRGVVDEDTITTLLETLIAALELFASRRLTLIAAKRSEMRREIDQLLATLALAPTIPSRFIQMLQLLSQRLDNKKPRTA